jgi:2-C-methyl-D-erythritol 4-phosphate cytidylyltransferase
MAEFEGNRTCAAMIVAAGASRRMGFDKLAAELAGVSVLRRTVEAFLAAESISEVVLVCGESRMADLGFESQEGNVAVVFHPQCPTKPIRRVDGGAERQDSVAAGLAMISSDFVAVHDGARPLIQLEEIHRCVAAALEHRAAALARRVTETLKRSDPEDFTTEAVSRERLWFMETPQVFEVALLQKAYAAVTGCGLTVTDEVSALEAIGVHVKLVESRHPNIKITTAADLALAEAILR